MLWLQSLALWYACGLFGFFFTSFWNVMDLVNYSMFMGVVAMRIYILTLLNSLDFNPPYNVYSNFHATAWTIYQAQNLIAVTCILSWLKLLRFLMISTRITQASAGPHSHA